MSQNATKTEEQLPFIAYFWISALFLRPTGQLRKSYSPSSQAEGHHNGPPPHRVPPSDIDKLSRFAARR